MTSSTNITDLLSGFASACWYDADAFTLEPIPNMGVGAIAKRDLKTGETLFRLPLKSILSPYSSNLKHKLDNWQELEGGWTQLILCMMWETSRGKDSPWHWYLSSMPTEFDTPMFWADSEKEWLQGTSIQDRIGREEAEQLYHDTIEPLVQANPQVFVGPYFGLDAFHMHGSRILSRSFTMESSTLDRDVEEEEDIVAMVPLADMLNAASGLDNAHLEFHDDCCQMVTTSDIAAGKQIYNTYSAPPNAELLRKYGHVDVLPLPEFPEWPFGNPEDDVDIDGSLVLNIVTGSGGSNLDKRVDWWMEAGQEDLRDGIDSELVSFVRLLTSDIDWKRARKTDEPPSGRLGKLDASAVEILRQVLLKRLDRYKTTESHDLEIAKAAASRSRTAAIVRIGERRCIAKGLTQLDALAVADGRAAKKARAA